MQRESGLLLVNVEQSGVIRTAFSNGHPQLGFQSLIRDLYVGILKLF